MAEYLNDAIEATDSVSKKAQLERARVVESRSFDPNTYEFDESFKNASSAIEAHTIHELVKFAESGECDIDARVLVANQSGRLGVKKMTAKEFIEASKSEPGKIKFKEAAVDTFLTDDYSFNAGMVGQDFTPLLGGPFFKQLYITDYLRMISACFYAYNHDPFARAIVQITRDFTLGRGWRADSENPTALALWNAFEEANDLISMFDHISTELSTYGETMVWWLPNNNAKIAFNIGPGQTVPKALIPRVRLIDPSCIWDICTYPEDITRVLYYQWVAPTQYQIYTNADKKTGERVPSTKFIYQQIPGDEVMHVKVNSVSNEKRGRSDLFPVLGYLKRLRDSVNYGVISMQKNMAWSVDTTIEGSQADIDAYQRSMQELGTIPMAGSEFVHSKKVERKYLANEGGKSQSSPIFDWCLSCIAAGTGIPVNYFGTHLNGGSTRASALVATEPVTKKFEKRRQVYEMLLKKMSRRLLDRYGIKDEIEFTFPELVSQDRSAKMKDMAMAQTMGWIKDHKLAPLAAKELDITDFDITKDLGSPQQATAASPTMTNPLTTPGQNTTPQPSAVTNDMRKAVDQNG